MLVFADVKDHSAILQLFLDDALGLDDETAARVIDAQSFFFRFFIDIRMHAVGGKDDDAVVNPIQQFQTGFSCFLDGFDVPVPQSELDVAVVDEVA